MARVNAKKKTNFGYTARERRSFPFVYLMLLIPVLHIIVFFFLVNFSAFTMAFQDVDGNWSFQSITRVIKSFTEGVDMWGFKPLEMLGHSLLLWFVLNVMCCVIGTFTSFILTKHMIFSKTLRVIFYIPGIVGGVVFSSVMRGIYAYNGPIISILGELGWISNPMVIKNGLLGCNDTAYITMLIQAFIFNITGANMVMAGAFMRIPNDIFESASLDGCGFFRETFQIAIPCAWSTLSTLIVFSLCTFFVCDYGFYLYSNGTGSHGLTSIGFYLYQFEVTVSQMPDTKYLHGYVSAFGMFITLITVPIVLLGRWLLTKINDSVEF